MMNLCLFHFYFLLLPEKFQIVKDTHLKSERDRKRERERERVKEIEREKEREKERKR